MATIEPEVKKRLKAALVLLYVHRFELYRPNTVDLAIDIVVAVYKTDVSHLSSDFNDR